MTGYDPSLIVVASASRHVAVAEALWQATKDPSALAALIQLVADVKKVEAGLKEFKALRNTLPSPGMGGCSGPNSQKEQDTVRLAGDAVDALGRIGPEAKAAVAVLVETLKDGRLRDSGWALWARSTGCSLG